jgi:hypothetical protein
MTTHGSPRKTNANKTVPKSQETPPNRPDLDLDAWLAQRMLDERRIKVGGKWFRFTGSATADQAARFRDVIAADGNVLDVMEVLLVDPGEAAELKETFNTQQRTPLGKDRLDEFVSTIVNHLIKGVDLGES